MEDAYEASFDWPYPASSVIITGDFDNWKRTIPLHRSGEGFTGKVKVPYGSVVHYKFIVDGEWKLLEGQPTERTPEGVLNNIIHTPPKFDALDAAKDKPLVISGAKPEAPTANGVTDKAEKLLPAAIAETSFVQGASNLVKDPASAVGSDSLSATTEKIANGDSGEAVSSEVVSPPTVQLGHGDSTKALDDAAASRHAVVVETNFVTAADDSLAQSEAPAEVVEQNHAEPIKSLADETVPHPIVLAGTDIAKAAQEFVASSSTAAEPVVESSEPNLSDPLKALANATAPHPAVIVGSNIAEAAHEFVAGKPADVPQLSAPELSSPLKALVDSTAPSLLATPATAIAGAVGAVAALVNGSGNGTKKSFEGSIPESIIPAELAAPIPVVKAPTVDESEAVPATPGLFNLPSSEDAADPKDPVALLPKASLATPSAATESPSPVTSPVPEPADTLIAAKASAAVTTLLPEILKPASSEAIGTKDDGSAIPSKDATDTVVEENHNASASVATKFSEAAAGVSAAIAATATGVLKSAGPETTGKTDDEISSASKYNSIDPKDPIALLPAESLANSTPDVGTLLSPAPGSPGNDHSLASKASELTASTSAAVAGSIPDVFKSVDSPPTAAITSTTIPGASTGPSVLNSLASNVVSNVGLAIKSLTGIDPINADKIRIEDAEAPTTNATTEISTPKEPEPAHADVQAVTADTSLTKDLVSEPVATPVPVAIQAATAEALPVKEATQAPTTAQNTHLVKPAAYSESVKDPAAEQAPATPPKDRLNPLDTSAPSERVFPGSSSSATTPTSTPTKSMIENGSTRKKRISFFGKIKNEVKGIFHSDASPKK